MAGRESRKNRIIKPNGGAWGSSSQDFVRIACILYTHSLECANRIDGNCSIYAPSGIPMLFSALRCLLIELNSGMFSQERVIPSNRLANSPNDIHLILEFYELPEELKNRLRTLSEVRNEIIHPSHMPEVTKNNTPAYLSVLKENEILQSTGEDSDYIWISQLQSHRLFRWAFENISATVKLLLERHKVNVELANGILESYDRYKTMPSNNAG